MAKKLLEGLSERLPPKTFPCFLTLRNNEIKIASKEHYDYLNEVADKLYQEFYGYISKPKFDYFCSSHPQESNCFCVALIMDDWCDQHDFNN